MFIGGDVSEDLKKIIQDATKRQEDEGVKLGPLEEIEVGVWKQIWSSTALGFGGIGGQCICHAYTFLAWTRYRQSCFVYFAGRFAYKITKPNESFWQAYNSREMPSIRNSHKMDDA